MGSKIMICLDGTVAICPNFTAPKDLEAYFQYYLLEGFQLKF